MTIVILGGGIDENQLPDQTKKRLNKAINISKKRSIDRFLVCGKYSFLFNEDEAPSVTEAELMRNYLIKQGIDEGKIYLETESMDTISNAYFAKTEYFLPEDKKEGIVITSNYHIPRVKYIFEKTFGSDYNLEFIGIDDNPSKKIIERQEKLLKETKEITKEMEDGDHQFLSDIFFNIDYYKKERPSWIKKKTREGAN